MVWQVEVALLYESLFTWITLNIHLKRQTLNKRKLTLKQKEKNLKLYIQQNLDSFQT